MTGPEVRTEWCDERSDVLPIKVAERSACERWLDSVGFLAAGKDDKAWEAIKRSWVSFLSATSTKPDPVLASNRKVVQFHDIGEESSEERKKRFGMDRKQRRRIQVAFWHRVDELEALSERWPAAARRILNQSTDGPDAQPFTSLASKWLLPRRRRFQAIWTSLVCFLAHSLDEGTLEEMGLVLNEEQEHDVLDVMQAAMPENGWWDKMGLQAAIQSLLTKAIMDSHATAQNNPVLWWAAILVRSALSEGDGDYISRGRFLMNILPMDVNIGERIEAVEHYSKVLVLDQAFGRWEGTTERIREVEGDLNAVDNWWLNADSGPRPDDSLDKRTCSSLGWKEMLRHLKQEGKAWLGGTEGTLMYEVTRLGRELRGTG